MRCAITIKGFIYLVFASHITDAHELISNKDLSRVQDDVFSTVANSIGKPITTKFGKKLLYFKQDLFIY